MSTTTRRGTTSKSETVFEADTANIIQDISDVPVERKDQYLKRMNKEKRAEKKIYVKQDEYIEILGKKVLRKFSNKAGSGYTMYWFNGTRFPAKVAEAKKTGGLVYDEGQPSERFLELRYVDGRPLKKRS